MPAVLRLPRGDELLENGLRVKFCQSRMRIVGMAFRPELEATVTRIFQCADRVAVFLNRAEESLCEERGPRS